MKTTTYPSFTLPLTMNEYSWLTEILQQAEEEQVARALQDPCFNEYEDEDHQLEALEDICAGVRKLPEDCGCELEEAVPLLRQIRKFQDRLADLKGVCAGCGKPSESLDI